MKIATILKAHFFFYPLIDLGLPLDKLNYHFTNSRPNIVPSRLSKLFGEKHQNVTYIYIYGGKHDWVDPLGTLQCHFPRPLCLQE